MELIFNDYGQDKELNAKTEEDQIFDVLQSMTDGELEFVRVSSNYVTARYKDWDVARFKFAKKAKWIFFPLFEKQTDRHPLASPQDVTEWTDLVQRSMEHIRKYT